MLKKSALGLLAAVVLFNVAAAGVYLVSIFHRDLSIPEAAEAFQEAVYGGNYEAMWDMSAEPYRGGRTREEFIEWARQNAPPPANVFEWTVLDKHTSDTAQAYTHIQISSGDVVTHTLSMVKVDGKWKVTGYEEYTGEWPPAGEDFNSQSG